MTGARFNELKAGATPTDEQERQEYERLLRWERRSDASKRAVQTKKNKYDRWPTRNNDHKRR